MDLTKQTTVSNWQCHVYFVKHLLLTKNYQCASRWNVFVQPVSHNRAELGAVTLALIITLGKHNTIII